MTIEEKINCIAKEYWPWSYKDDSMQWTWEGIYFLSIASQTYGPTMILDLRDKRIKHMYLTTLNTIKNADSSEYLTSNSEYIRECKKFFIQNPKFNIDREHKKIKKNLRKRRIQSRSEKSHKKCPELKFLSLILDVYCWAFIVFAIITFSRI